ncbi:MAG: multicopper oxidase domain-containing protein [Verrucomicrobiales bacterium]
MTPLHKLAILTTSLLLTSLSPLRARTVEHHLTIDHGTVNFTGKDRPAMTINGGIPGPTLRFREGDQAVIHVHNKMKVATSIHWHGILLPNDQDGVPYLTYPPIAPGTTFTYRFPITHAGTYWYHSHSGLQEQQGVYGSIAIEPKQNRYGGIRDEVILLSDWSDENPHEIMRTLKRGSEWYSVKKGSAQSVLGAAKAGQAGNFFKRELTRMPPMDIADVAYDKFLANGQPESHISAKPGQRLRLRLIDGSATTYFFVEFAGGPMKIISSDGVDVQPFEENRFLITIAETYDVLVTVPKSGSYELRATAHDGSGYASVWIGQGEKHPAPDVVKPDLYALMGGVTLRSMTALTPAGSMGMSDAKVEAGAFDQPGMNMGDTDMGGMKMESGMDMNAHGMAMPMNMSESASPHAEMAMPSNQPMGDMSGRDHSMMSSGEMQGMDHGGNSKMAKGGHSMGEMDKGVDGMDPRRPWPNYSKLRALKPTNYANDKPRRDIRLTLDGNMSRYVWLLNNKALHEQDKITVREGEVARFILINRTMMHHPMHLHGHFFRVINGQGDYSPLKHTVNVAPMSTTVIEFDANDSGDWFFHCHVLYHMHSGMARIVHYDGFEPSPEVADIRHNLLEDPWYFWTIGAGMSHMTEGNITLSNTRNILNTYWKVGWQNVEETEYEVNLTYAYSFNRFSSVFAGAQLTNGALGDRGIFGARYLLPLRIQATGWVDTEGEFRIGVGKELPLTSRLSVFGEVEYDTQTDYEWQAGATFMLNKNLSLIGSYHSDFGAGAGLTFSF